MVREDILGGLKNALSRGQTLMQAMMSFYNAGYMREEIEEAARYLQLEKSQPMQSQFASGPVAPIFQRTAKIERDPNKQLKEVLSQTAKSVEPAQSSEKTIQKVSAYGQPAQPQQITPTTPTQPVQQPAQPLQKVSAYGQPLPTKKPRGKAIIFILLALLIFLIGGLIAVFFFKEEILSFFT